MRHFQASPLETTLNIEAFVGLTAVQYALIATDLLSNVVERLDDAQTQLLALLVLCYGNVFNVSHQPHVMNKLALDEDAAGTDDTLFGVAYD